MACGSQAKRPAQSTTAAADGGAPQPAIPMAAWAPRDPPIGKEPVVHYSACFDLDLTPERICIPYVLTSKFFSNCVAFCRAKKDYQIKRIGVMHRCVHDFI